MNHHDIHQLRPACEPGVRFDPAGNATFTCRGFTVHVHIRYATTDDFPQPQAGEVAITATVHACGVLLATQQAPADWEEPWTVTESVNVAVQAAADAAAKKITELSAFARRQQAEATGR